MPEMETESSESKRSVILVTTLGSFLVPFMGSSVTVALPSMGRDFGMNAILLSWVTTSYLLAVGMFLVPFGRIADIYGRKKVFLYGFVVYTVSSLLIAVSNSSSVFILLRVLQGTGASMSSPTMVAILTSVCSPEERGRVLGINVAAVYSGLSCGPFLGGLLTYHWGWRSIFFLNVPFGMFIIVLTLWKLRGEWKEAKGEKFDLAGSLYYSFTLVAIMYGFSQLPGRWGMFLLFLGTTGFYAFTKREFSATSPLFDLTLFRNNRVFAFSNLAALINYSATFAVTFLLSLYLQIVKGLNPQDAGMVLIAQPIIQAICSPFAGRLSDRSEPRRVASIGMGFTVVGLLLLCLIDEETTMPFIIVSLTLLGLGFGLFSSPNTNAVMSSIEKKFYGVASGTLGTMRATGMMFSMGMTMLIFSLYLGRTQITPSLSPLLIESMRAAFILFSFLCVAGIFASLSRGKIR